MLRTPIKCYLDAVHPAGKVIVVTGGAAGIGAALASRFRAEGARFVAVADIAPSAEFQVDVGCEAEVRSLVERVEAQHGPIDLFCSNAGIMVGGGTEVTDSDWARIWNVNVNAHLYAARAVLPGMIARGAGYLLQTVSAAGLLSQIGSAPYAVTKHAALAFAEWLAITHYEQGIRVSALCPQGVSTAMLENTRSGMGALLREAAVTPEHVADCALRGLAEERFLILPHPEVGEYFLRKATDYERWLRGMRRLQEKARQ